MDILEAIELTKHFGALAAVDGVSFSLKEGEILGLIGPNGAGKTTTFNMIVGMLRPTAGRVIFEGKDITGMKPHRICRQGVAKTSQVMEPFKAMTVHDNVLVAALHGGRMRMRKGREKADEVLAFVGLVEKRDRLAGAVSVPDRRRLELARALSTGARVLLLDECLAGLTPTEIDEALEILRSIRDLGKSLIVVEHVMRAVMGISDRIVVLNHGGKIAEGAPEWVANREEVIEAYLGRDWPESEKGAL